LKRPTRTSLSRRESAAAQLVGHRVLWKSQFLRCDGWHEHEDVGVESLQPWSGRARLERLPQVAIARLVEVVADAM